MATFISHSPAETAGLGEQWGRDAQPGLVIGLSGDLGAGKTELVKGIARGLGVTDRVQSPTFALVNTYGGGRLPLHHLDLYRLQTIDQILAAGLEEFLHSGGVTVIEWVERWFDRNAPPGSVSSGHATRNTGLSSAASATEEYTIRPAMLVVAIDEIGPTQRRIVYENPRA